MNWRPNWQLVPAARSTLSSPSTDRASSDSTPRSASRWLWITYMASALAVVPGLVLWDAHKTRQITQVEDLGLARDVQWLGTSGQF